MKKLKILVLLVVFVLGMGVVNAQETDSNVAITLERTACFGTCPVYTIAILEDGTVQYNGGDFVQVTGEQTSQIDPALVAQMVEAFADAGYFEWDEAYDTQDVSDLSTVITSVTRDGETHRISRYLGDSSAPLALAFLERWIELTTTSSLWTGVEQDVSTISNGTDTPLLTLEQTACFGACPVYNVAVFEDGTVVFTGLANVKDIGVHVFETDAAIITGMAQRAQLTGYFDWQDRYDYMMITDQVYVITSVRWEDQSKQILRYGGDPNAPVGLTWIENEIAGLVTDLVS